MDQIQIQRRLDFEQAFGPFSFWALLPFKKLPGFWHKIVSFVESKSFEVVKSFEYMIENIHYVNRYVQGLYPV